MSEITRNKFLIIGGVLALCLIGIGGFYFSRKKEVLEPINVVNEENEVLALVSELDRVETVKVDIKGAIKSPGVYEVDSNSIVNDVIDLAGG